MGGILEMSMKKKTNQKKKQGSVREVDARYAVRKRVSMNDIQAIANRIAEGFAVDKIILFGSYAHGMPREGSDVDLCVVMSAPGRTFARTLDIIHYLCPLRFGIDIVVRTEDDFTRRIPQGDFFLQEILEKGKVLYVR